MRRPPAFPPSAPRKRPPELREEIEKLRHTPEVARPAPEPKEEITTGVSTRLKERLEELRGAKRQARKKQLLYIAGALAVAGLLLWLVAFSPVLALRMDSLEVAGTNEFVSKSDVVSVVEPFEGVPLARIDTGGILEELKRDHAVKDALFTRVWPSGLKVTLEPRTPVAATPQEEGYAIVDGEGVKLGTSSEQVEGLPIVEVDADTEELAATIDAVLAVMDTLPAGLLEQVATVGAKSPNEVEFTLDGGARVVWGSAQDSDLKSSVLEVLLEVPANVYNVVAPLSPITS